MVWFEVVVGVVGTEAGAVPVAPPAAEEGEAVVAVVEELVAVVDMALLFLLLSLLLSLLLLLLLSSSLSTVRVPANHVGLFGSSDRISLLIIDRERVG